MTHDALKADLCRGARLLYRLNLSTGLAGHLSIKVGPDAMLANRFGRSFGTLVPDDVLELDLKGNVIAGRGQVNDTIRLHGVIHERNPEIVALAHAHPPGIVTFSTLRTVPDIFDQESCSLAGDVGIIDEDYGGLASSEDRVLPFAKALAEYRAVILPNHGAITRGANLPQAIITMMSLEQMVQRNLAVAAASRATGIAAKPISPEVARLTKQELAALKALPMAWEDLMARLRLTDEELFR